MSRKTTGQSIDEFQLNDYLAFSLVWLNLIESLILADKTHIQLKKVRHRKHDNMAEGFNQLLVNFLWGHRGFQTIPEIDWSPFQQGLRFKKKQIHQIRHYKSIINHKI